MFNKLFLGLTILVLLSACQSEPPSPALSPEEELETFQLEEGLRIELVAAEPMVQDPVVINFDEDGRLWVVEMRGFMPNVEMEGEDAPVGRISVLLDQDTDGRMDSSVVFLDSLVLPRALAFVPGGVLVAEKKPLWFVQDLDGDLVADQKTLLDSVYGGRGLPEHAPNGLWRNIDNWYYNAKSVLRYKFGSDHQLITDSTEFRGQWGISHDDAGRLYYNYNWSQLHGDLVPPNYFSRNPNHEATSGIDHGLTIDRRVYPIRPTPAVNRGYIPGTLNEEGKLQEFTSACAPLVYRGDLLPGEYKGNAFVCEPAGNLIKRNIVQASGPILSAHDPNPGTEFLASTDERFRPVYLADGPDGALYVADMYRGINQHGAYMTPYLKEKILKRKLETPIHKGRIWRIVPEGSAYQPSTTLSAATQEELIAHLSADNGWLRDAAQRLLIEHNNLESIPALEQLATSGNRDLGRLHALWTLEGMGAIKAEVLFAALEEPNPLLQNTALRMLEPLAQKDAQLLKKVQDKMQGLWSEAKPETALQIALTAGICDLKDKRSLLASLAQKYVATPLMRDAILSSLKDDEFLFFQHLSNHPEWQELDLNQEILLEMLAAAVARKGNPQELSKILNQLNKPEAAYTAHDKTLLNGLAIQAPQLKDDPVFLSEKPALLANDSEYSLAVQQKLQSLSQLFAWPGKPKESPDQKEQALDDKALQAFAKGRTHYLTACAGCHGTDGTGLKRFAPPLVNSEWVLGDKKKLALILLHGLEGPIDVAGIKYDAPDILPVMPAHSTMDDGDIAAILTYIRNEWGHQATPVARGLVGKTRVTSQGRVVPWTAEELAALPVETEEQPQ